MMTVKERIRLSILIEKMNGQKEYSKKLGLEDVSKLHGERIHREEEKESCRPYFLSYCCL